MVHLDDTFLSDVSGYAPLCGWFTSNQSTSAHIVPLESADSAEGLTAFTVISGPPDLSLTVSPACICALSAMLHSSVLRLINDLALRCPPVSVAQMIIVWPVRYG